MRIDVVKIIEIIAPLILALIQQKVPKKKTNLYRQSAEATDKVMDSLQDLAIKVSTEPDKEIDAQNLKSGIEITEKMIEAAKDRVAVIKKLSGI